MFVFCLKYGEIVEVRVHFQDEKQKNPPFRGERGIGQRYRDVCVIVLSFIVSFSLGAPSKGSTIAGIRVGAEDRLLCCGAPW